MMEGTYSARVAVRGDFEKLKPLMQANCLKMRYDWGNYSTSALDILSNANYGFFLLAEVDHRVVVGFVLVTCAGVWRNNFQYYRRESQIVDGANEEEISAALQAAFEAHKPKLITNTCLGIEQYNPSLVSAAE